MGNSLSDILREMFTMPNVSWEEVWVATYETIYMTVIATIFAFVLGIILGVLLFYQLKVSHQSLEYFIALFHSL